MAIRHQTAHTNNLARTTNVPSGNFTFCCWAKFYSFGTGTDFRTLFFRGDATNEWPFFGTEPSKLHLYTGTADAIGTTALSTGTWYHVACVRNSSTDWKVYLNGVQEASAATEQTGITANSMRVFSDPPFDSGNGVIDCAVAAVKIWDTNLSAAEIQQEMMQYLPIRTANLNIFTPGNDAAITDAAKDYSGSANNWTVNGTLTTEDGPPIPWKQGRRRMFVPAAAAGGAQTVTLAFVSSSEQIFTPAVTLNLTPGFISSGEQIFTPTVTQNVLPGFIASGEQIFTPTVTQNVTPGFIASGEQIFAPTVSQNVTLSAIATTEQVFTPAISQNVLLGAIASGEQVFSINASFGLTVTLGFIPSGEQIFTPTVTQKVLLPAIATTAQVFTLAVSTPSNGDPEPNIDITISFSGPCYDVSLSGSNYDCDLNGSKLDVSFR